jgi:hypothetical protein
MIAWTVGWCGVPAHRVFIGKKMMRFECSQCLAKLSDGTASAASRPRAHLTRDPCSGSSTSSAGPNSPLQETLGAAAMLNFEGPDAIRMDGTGSAGGILGGLCVTCPGSSLAQGIYLAATVVPLLSWGLSALDRKAAAEGLAAEGLEASSAVNAAFLRNQLISEEIAGGARVQKARCPASGVRGDRDSQSVRFGDRKFPQFFKHDNEKFIERANCVLEQHKGNGSHSQSGCH